jgi:hypothetical protein
MATFGALIINVLFSVENLCFIIKELLENKGIPVVFIM